MQSSGLRLVSASFLVSIISLLTVSHQVEPQNPLYEDSSQYICRLSDAKLFEIPGVPTRIAVCRMDQSPSKPHNKVPLIHNEAYRPNGTKSYVSLISKFAFNPTKPGPYKWVMRMRQRGRANMTLAVGGRAFLERVLVRQQGLAGGSQPTDLTADEEQNDALYLCEVGLGTPAQKVRLELDTSSADLWVFVPETGMKDTCAIFDPKKSASYSAAADKQWKLEREDGSSISGDAGRDVVTIGSLEVKEQVIQLAKTFDKPFSERTSDGCLGLAFPQLNTIQTAQRVPDAQNTLVASLGTKHAQLFSTVLNNPKTGEGPSSVSLGHIDQGLVKASGRDISWAAIIDDRGKTGLWKFPSGSATIGANKLPRPGNAAVADTSSPLVLVGDDVCEALYRQIRGAKYSEAHQGYVIPRGVGVADLPRFGLAVGGGGENETFFIPPEELLFAEADEGGWYGAVQSRGDNSFDVLGHPFLRSVYAIWDQGNSRFGCVPRM